MNSLADHKNSPNNTQNGTQGFLFSQLLLATPVVNGGCFDRAVVLVAAHDDSGAMGIIINKQIKDIKSREVLETMQIKLPKKFTSMPIYLGGPVETARGFVIHSSDYEVENTITYPCGIKISSERQVLQDYIDGVGPKQLILALGYAGWVKGQLENELLDNAWINLPADKDLIFEPNFDAKWQKTAQKYGIAIEKIAPTTGLA